MAIFLDGNKAPYSRMGETVEGIVVFGCETSVAVYRIESGTVSPPERHPEEQGNYFIRGRMEWIVGEGDTQHSYICEPGTLLVVAPNEPHSNRVLGEDEVLMLSFFGPPREGHRSLAAAEADCQ